MYVLRSMGDAPATPAASSAPAPASFNLSGLINSEPVSTASAVLLTYHGYRRTGSLIWALIYGALGKWKPAIAAPIAIAQGFAERKPCP